MNDNLVTDNWRSGLRDALAGAEKIAVLGVGSELCGDDAVGMLLVDRLRKQGLDPSRVLLLGGSTAPENFTGVVCAFAPQVLLVVDAADSGSAVGEIAMIDPAKIADCGLTTHMLPLSLMLDYLAAEAGCRILVLGVQPGEMEFATPPGDQALAAVAELTACLAACLPKLQA